MGYRYKLGSYEVTVISDGARILSFVYGPLANGATTLIFEGVPNYPNT
jgi:hypothetical protein